MPASPASSVATKTLWDTIVAGGWTMIPIGALLVMAIFIFVERYLTIRKANADSEELMKQVRKHVLSGNLDAAKGLCEAQNNPFARMIHKGISRLGTASLKDIEASIENVGQLEVFRLERRLSLLATVAGAAPMLGFFGTVLGMIDAFNSIVSTGGNPSPTDLASGISEAMITTAAGLIVGIPAYFFYNILTAMINKVVLKMEITSTDFIDLLQEPAN
ncbi:MAG: MotA/TolQ/ExbB proton channel family protein [Bacteroidia bacterium]|nr:MotA/TolQ/ExbB proton channel family protein [Bacteroidia bacterium]